MNQPLHTQLPKHNSLCISLSLDTHTSLQEVVDLPHALNMATDKSVGKLCILCYLRLKQDIYHHLESFSFVIESIIREPTSTTKALSHPDWYKAMQVEYEALMKNFTWELIPSKADQHPVVHK